MQNLEFYIQGDKLLRVKVKDGKCRFNGEVFKLLGIGEEEFDSVYNPALKDWEWVKALSFVELENSLKQKIKLVDVLLEPLSKKPKENLAKAVAVNGNLIIFTTKNTTEFRVFTNVEGINPLEEGSWTFDVGTLQRIDLLELALNRKPAKLAEISKGFRLTCIDLVKNRGQAIELHLEPYFKRFVELAIGDVEFKLTNESLYLEIELEQKGSGSCEFDLLTPIGGEAFVKRGKVRAKALQELIKHKRTLALNYLDSRGVLFESFDTATGITLAELIN